MSLNFKQKIFLAILAGFFAVLAAYVSKSEKFPYQQVNVPNSHQIAISNNGNASATSNINIIDNRVTATNGGIAISSDLNQEPNKNQDVRGNLSN